MIDINLTGVFHVTQCFVRQLLKADKPGAIVNLASISGIVAFNGSSSYSVTKAAVSELTRCLAMEYGQYGIRTNAMAPGLIETDMTSVSINQPDMAAEWMQRIPMRKWGTPEDVADLALFLASDEAGYINGETVVVDGGAVPAFSKPGDQTRTVRRDWP
jgi:3-oxoacyl-[acyl-carrier protein] reductase